MRTETKFIKENIAGLSIKGGRRDNFFFCLLEFYPDSSRYFLKSLLQVKDEDVLDGNDALMEWMDQFGLTKLMVNFPLSYYPCKECNLECIGHRQCKNKDVKSVSELIGELLDKDQQRIQETPKNYERERLKDEEFDYNKDLFEISPDEHILSRSFKRRLKKGLLPYWNRPLDFWIWSNYHDILLKLFKNSYDSFGHVPLMLLARMDYLHRFFKQRLTLFESNVQIALVELLRSKIILQRDIIDLADIITCATARRNIIKKIEEKLDIFIYANDLEILTKNSPAFESFILALVGKRLHAKMVRVLPDYCRPEETRFTVPLFLT